MEQNNNTMWNMAWKQLDKEERKMQGYLEEVDRSDYANTSKLEETYHGLKDKINVDIDNDKKELLKINSNTVLSPNDGERCKEIYDNSVQREAEMDKAMPAVRENIRELNDRSFGLDQYRYLVKNNAEKLRKSNYVARSNAEIESKSAFREAQSQEQTDSLVTMYHVKRENPDISPIENQLEKAKKINMDLTELDEKVSNDISTDPDKYVTIKKLSMQSDKYVDDLYKIDAHLEETSEPVMRDMARGEINNVTEGVKPEVMDAILDEEKAFRNADDIMVKMNGIKLGKDITMDTPSLTINREELDIIKNELEKKDPKYIQNIGDKFAPDVNMSTEEILNERLDNLKAIKDNPELAGKYRAQDIDKSIELTEKRLKEELGKDRDSSQKIIGASKDVTKEAPISLKDMHAKRKLRDPELIDKLNTESAKEDPEISGNKLPARNLGNVIKDAVSHIEEEKRSKLVKLKKLVENDRDDGPGL